MKRTRISLEQVMSFDNVCLATHKAAKGKRHRQSVQQFLKTLPENIDDLRQEVIEQENPLGQYKRFTLCDPKPRIIHAAAFRCRVLHHALMNIAGPTLDNALTDHVFACRKQKGLLKATHYVQRQCQQYPWVVQIDVDGYFANIDHNHPWRCYPDALKVRRF